MFCQVPPCSTMFIHLSPCSRMVPHAPFHVLTCSAKPKKQTKKHYTIGKKLPNTLLCRLRVGRSFFKSHGFAINLSQTDKCFCGDVDSIQNYFFNSFLFKTERLVLLSNVNNIYPPFQNYQKQSNVKFYYMTLF